MSTVTQTPVENLAARSLMLIGGKAVESADGRFIDIENPATRRVMAQVPRGGEQDIDNAVRAAAAAFEQWKRVPPKDRGRMLLRIADLVEAETESLARIVALETGNAIRTQARPEIRSTAEVIRYYGGLAGETKGETVPLGEHVLSYTFGTTYQPSWVEGLKVSADYYSIDLKDAIASLTGQQVVDGCFNGTATSAPCPASTSSRRI